MSSGSTTFIVSAALWSTFVQSPSALRFYCEAYNVCKIWNWNPREEGTFVLDHVPNTHGRLELYNLLISSATSGLFDLFETSRRDMESSVIVKMSALRSFALENNASLKTVEFENTFLSSILFGKNCSVTNLKIKRSKLTHLPISIHELKDLNMLTISHSLIQAVNLKVVAELPKLSLLDLTQNRIHALYFATQKTMNPTVISIHLGKNRLRSVNINLFNAMKFLEMIDLSHNRISAVSGSLVSSSLNFLDLSFNRLLKLDCCKWVVPSLSNLVANDNNFLALPRCIEQTLINVSFVDFHHNQLHRDETSRFGKFDNLQYLTLDNNKLTYVTLNKSTIPMKMNYLSLSNNKLRRLEIPYVPNKDLYIDVSSNCISSVDWDKVSTNLTMLEMKGNPLDCSLTASILIRSNISCVVSKVNKCDLN